MHFIYSALMTLSFASWMPFGCVAQVLTPFDPVPRDYDQRLNHLVSVATVSPLGEPIALADAHPVYDPPGAPFVVGAATLDLSDPTHAKLVFSMTNASERPIPWEWVELEEVSVVLRPDNGDLFFGCSISGRAGHRGTWQAGQKVTVQLPLAPVSNCFKPGSEPQGALVLVVVQRPGTLRDVSGDSELFSRAFQRVRSQSKR